MSRRSAPAAGYAERSAVSKKISAVVPNSAFDQLREIATSRGVSLSQVTREAVLRFIEREGQVDG